MKIRIILIVTASLLCTQMMNAQDKEIDASKPTNFYSMLDNTMEFSSQKNQNVFGYRGKVSLAPSEAHLILGEIPIMYNDRTSKFGLGDIRARYFYLPYKDYSKTIGAFGLSVDVFMPTGNFENGLGSGRWIVAPGVTAGIMAAEWVQFFPVLSYQYMSKPTYDNPTPEANNDVSGITFQVITPIVFSEKFFVSLTPIYKINNINNINQDRFAYEFLASFSLTATMLLTGFYSGTPEEEIHTMSVGLTIYL